MWADLKHADGITNKYGIFAEIITHEMKFKDIMITEMNYQKDRYRYEYHWQNISKQNKQKKYK